MKAIGRERPHKISGTRVLCGSQEIGEVWANGEIRGEIMHDGSIRPHWSASLTQPRFAHIGYRSTKAEAGQAVIDSHECTDPIYNKRVNDEAMAGISAQMAAMAPQIMASAGHSITGTDLDQLEYDAQGREWWIRGKVHDIWITMRPTYCDRGRFFAEIEMAKGPNAHLYTIEPPIDLWPRAYMDANRMVAELRDWLAFREQNL